MDAGTAEQLTRAFLHGMSAGAAIATVLLVGLNLWLSRRGNR